MCFCWSIVASSIISFTVSCCSLIWLFSAIAPSWELSRYTNIFRLIWSVSRQINCPHLNCPGFACSDSAEASGSSTLVGFENFLVFFFLFLNFQQKFPHFFLVILVISPVTPEVLLHFRFPTHKRRIYQWAFKLTVMVCYNHSSLMILVNDAKYIQFLLISSTSLSPFILQV